MLCKMNESILSTIKKLLGVTDDYDYFDQDLLIHINSALMSLSQIGVRPSQDFYTLDKDTTWSEYLGYDYQENIDFGSIKSYIYLKVKLLFDPPQNSFTIEAINKMITEMEWRINIVSENQNGGDGDE